MGQRRCLEGCENYSRLTGNESVIYRALHKQRVGMCNMCAIKEGESPVSNLNVSPQESENRAATEPQQTEGSRASMDIKIPSSAMMSP